MQCSVDCEPWFSPWRYPYKSWSAFRQTGYALSYSPILHDQPCFSVSCPTGRLNSLPYVIAYRLYQLTLFFFSMFDKLKPSERQLLPQWGQSLRWDWQTKILGVKHIVLMICVHTCFQVLQPNFLEYQTPSLQHLPTPKSDQRTLCVNVCILKVPPTNITIAQSIGMLKSANPTTNWLSCGKTESDGAFECFLTRSECTSQRTPTSKRKFHCPTVFVLIPHHVAFSLREYGSSERSVALFGPSESTYQLERFTLSNHHRNFKRLFMHRCLFALYSQELGALYIFGMTRQKKKLFKTYG